jgi:hypothetical protein
VDSPVPHLELVRPWRTATLVAAAIAAVELALLVVAGLVLVGRSLAPHANAATPKAAVTHTAKTVKPKLHLAAVVAKLPRAKVHVMILNGNGVQGAAASAASLVGARGYAVGQVGNASRSYPTWRVMYAPGFAGEAERFAHDLNIRVASVGPLDGMKPRQLHGAQLLLTLGSTR